MKSFLNVESNRRPLANFHRTYPLSACDSSNNSSYYLLSTYYMPGHFAISSLSLTAPNNIDIISAKRVHITYPKSHNQQWKNQDSNSGMSVWWITGGCKFSASPPSERWSLFSSPWIWAGPVIRSDQWNVAEGMCVISMPGPYESCSSAFMHWEVGRHTGSSTTLRPPCCEEAGG